MIRFQDVSVRFGQVEAVRKLDLNLQGQQTHVLIGPSGCGKSTILRLLVGLETPNGGTVQVDGTTVAPSSHLSLRRRMGYLIQEGGLFPHLTARENVTLMARHLQRPGLEIESRLEDLCALTHFPRGGLERYPAELSGGQKQRVGLMRALMMDPDVLLLDEPLGALDPLVRRELQDELRSIFRRLAKTVVFVTHDLVEAAYLADHIILMKSGEVVQSGTLEDLRLRPRDSFVSDFLAAQRRPVEI